VLLLKQRCVCVFSWKHPFILYLSDGAEVARTGENGGNPIQRNSPLFSFSEDLPARVVVREHEMNGVIALMCFVQVDFGDTIVEWRICPAMLAEDATWIEKKTNPSAAN
jgi:hypothetical protein